MTAGLSWVTPAAAARLRAALDGCTAVLVLDPEHGIGLACDLEAGHDGPRAVTPLHHDPVSGARWRRCLMSGHGHEDEGEGP